MIGSTASTGSTPSAPRVPAGHEDLSSIKLNLDALG
jgi:hypothetical protein